jgi:hypothetical protein
MNFSTRTGWDLAENDLTARARRRRAAGLEPARPHRLQPHPVRLPLRRRGTARATRRRRGAALHAGALRHGRCARRGLALYYRDHGADIKIDRICLTTSTSEAYSFLFRLLCNPGDEVLAARPSYPLFDFIAQLDDVVLRDYPLHYDPNADTPAAALLPRLVHRSPRSPPPSRPAPAPSSWCIPTTPPATSSPPPSASRCNRSAPNATSRSSSTRSSSTTPSPPSHRTTVSAPLRLTLPHLCPQRPQQDLRSAADEGLLDRRLRPRAASAIRARPIGSHRRHLSLHERAHPGGAARVARPARRDTAQIHDRIAANLATLDARLHGTSDPAPRAARRLDDGPPRARAPSTTSPRPRSIAASSSSPASSTACPRAAPFSACSRRLTFGLAVSRCCPRLAVTASTDC